MSANDIVVIKKEEDGKFRGYHRDMDAYCEGQYDYDGPCQFCMDGCEMCNYTKHYTSPEETFIFEAETIVESVFAYSKWCENMMYPVEYGYEFQGLELNAETVEAVRESDLMSVKGNLKFILDRIVNTSNKGMVFVNDLTPEMVREKVGKALDLLNNPLQKVDKVESVDELVKELNEPTDTELLDFLQLITDNAAYTGKVICRASTTGRGWRLCETSWDGAVSDVRQAITNYMKWVLKGEKQNENNPIC